MRFFLASAMALTMLCSPLLSRERSIVYSNGSATVAVNDPAPLARAIIGVREEYGWVVDYEDPPWQSGDLRDVSPAAWHAAHPGRRGAMAPDGGAFQSTYPMSPDMWGSASEELQVLNKIVSDYNASGNPGRFVVRVQTDGSYAVIGVSTKADNGSQVSVTPYLDTPISLETTTRSALTTLDLILSAVSAKTGIVCLQGGLGLAGLLTSTNVSVGGTDLPARQLLTQLFQAMGVKMCWRLWFSPDLQRYELILDEAALAIPGPFGQNRFVPISPAQGAASGGPQ